MLPILQAARPAYGRDRRSLSPVPLRDPYPVVIPTAGVDGGPSIGLLALHRQPDLPANLGEHDLGLSDAGLSPAAGSFTADQQRHRGEPAERCRHMIGVDGNRVAEALGIVGLAPCSRQACDAALRIIDRPTPTP